MINTLYFPILWRGTCRLLHQLLDVVHTIVAGGVELKDVVRPLFVERLAALGIVACLAVLLGVLAVDGFGEDAAVHRWLLTPLGPQNR